MLGRAKSCRWQVFVRRRPPKQGELRTDVSKATMLQGDRGLRPSGLRGRFKALPEKISAKFSDGTSRNRFFAQNGSEKALNRCEVPALQREDLERTAKEQRRSLVDSRLWLGANLRCRLRKFASFEDSKMACSNRQCFGCEKDLFFSSCKATRKRKVFSQHSKTSPFRHTQTNGSQQISSAKTLL